MVGSGHMEGTLGTDVPEVRWHRLSDTGPTRPASWTQTRSFFMSGRLRTATRRCAVHRVVDPDLGWRSSSTAIAIETPRGSVGRGGLHVFAGNPKQPDRFRDRHAVAGAKDDSRDAFVLGDFLRTDLPCFRRGLWTMRLSSK